MFKIGIIDSGSGGLSVARAIKQTIPEINIHYFADHKHLPYGEKSRNFLKNRVETIASHLISQGCNFIVIACHSASAQLESSALSFPWLGVVQPTVNAIKLIPKHARIGVIGTNATINSGIYQNIDKNIAALATPELAELIENQTLTQDIVSNILNEKLPGISHLVLACTHYPLAQKLFVQPNLSIIDTPRLCAQNLKQLIGSSSGDGKITIESTATSAKFINFANQMLAQEPETSVL